MSSGAPSRRVSLVLAGLIAMTSVVIGSVVAAPPASACSAVRGNPPYINKTPWSVTRLRVRQLADFATGKKVRIAVVDSGVTKSQAQLEHLEPEVAIPGITDGADCGAEEGTQATNGHGTGVAALIAADWNQKNGFRGIAPDATIIPVKWIDPNVKGTADTMAAAIRLALQHRPDIINLSVDGHADTPALRSAVLAAQKQGVIIVASAGNGQQGQGTPQGSWPAKYAADPKKFPLILSVAATDANDQFMQGAPSGDWINIAAPGVGMMVPSTRQNFYQASGTSFAAPLVAGTAALVIEAHPELTPAQVVQRIEQTADPDAPATEYGAGIVDPLAAVTAVLDTDPSNDSATTTRPARMHFPPPPNHRLQRLAYAAAAGLLALAIAFAIGTAAWRRTAEHNRTT